MSVIITNGQSWEQIAADFTLDAAYAPALAIQNNMEDQSITGKRFRIEIPDGWMKPEYSGKSITLPAAGALTPYAGGQLPGIVSGTVIPGVPNWVLWTGGGLAVLLLLMPKR
jgi:hypothetical protein